MAEHHTVPMGDGRQAHVVFSDVSDGDFRVRDPQPDLAANRAAIRESPWSWIIQVHEADVLAVDHPGHHAGAVADGLMTVTTGCPIAVTTADCAPVVLVAESGVAVVHAGWRGLVAGIVERAAAMLTERAGQPMNTLLGPCIGPENYQFGPEELAIVADRLGQTVRATTTGGDPALDVPAAVAAACERAGWPRPPRPPSTSELAWFSHRVRGDVGRQTAVVWLENGQELP